MEFGGELLRAAASADVLHRIGEARDDWLGLIARRSLGEGDRHLLQGQDRIARVWRQDLARVLDGDDRKTARGRNRLTDRARLHLLERAGQGRRQLFRANPAKIAADGGRRSLRIFARIAGKGRPLPQLGKDLVGVLEDLRLRGRGGREIDLADPIFLRTFGRIELVEDRFDLVVADADAVLDLPLLQAPPRNLALDLAPERADVRSVRLEVSGELV